MNKKNSLFRKIIVILSFPFMAMWTVITGDTGSTALFVNDIAKQDNEVTEKNMHEMTK